MKITKKDIVKLIQEELESLQEFDVEKRKMRDIPIEERSQVLNRFLGEVVKTAAQISAKQLNIEDDERDGLKKEIQGLLFGVMDYGPTIVSQEMAERIAEIYIGKKKAGSLE